jgi:hypothetical protein
MCHNALLDDKLYEFLVRIDQDLAAQTQANASLPRSAESPQASAEDRGDGLRVRPRTDADTSLRGEDRRRIVAEQAVAQPAGEGIHELDDLTLAHDRKLASMRTSTSSSHCG